MTTRATFTTTPLWILTLILTFIFGFSPAHASGDVALVEKMTALQYFSHKTTLAIDHKNAELANFYAHELEEIIEELETVKQYHGQPIAKLVKTILVPAFENLESNIKAKRWSASSNAADQLISSCNQCHQAADHGFIVIERRKDNPFLQSFTP